jgi:hypothetical protein
MILRIHWLIAGGLAVAIAQEACSAASLVNTGFRTVILSGQPATNLPADVSFGVASATLSRNTPVINAAGDLAFIARLAGPGVTADNQDAVYLEQGGALRMIARAGAPAPGMRGVSFDSFPDGFPNLSAQGTVVFEAVLQGAGVTAANDRSLWVDRAGQLTMIAREGQAIAGLPVDPQYLGARTGKAKFDADDSIYFESGLLDAPASYLGPSHAVFRHDASGLTAMVSRFSSPPGLANLNLVVDFVVSQAGDLAVHGVLNLPLAENDFDGGVWLQNAGQLFTIARESQVTADFPFHVEFEDPSITTPFSSLGINSAGHVLFASRLVGDFGPFVRDGIWIGFRRGTLVGRRLVGAEGLALSGAPEFTLLEIGSSSVGSLQVDDVVFSELGDAAFPARISNASTAFDGESLLAYRNGLLDVVIKDGDPAPGLPTGYMFAFPSGLREVGLSGDGSIVFQAGFRSSPDATATFGEGWWLVDREGVFQLLLKVGDLIEVLPGDFREVEFVQFLPGSSGANGKPTSLNNQRQFTLQANFTDGSQAVLVTGRILIPEPASAVLVLVALVGLLSMAANRRPRG